MDSLTASRRSQARTYTPLRATPTIQGQIIPCAWASCSQLFTPRYEGGRFCCGKCRAMYSKHHGIVGTLVSSRRLRRRISVVIHTEDAGVLDAPIGARFRLVREP